MFTDLSYRAYILNVRLALDDRVELERVAAEHGRSLSAMARDALLNHLREPMIALPHRTGRTAGVAFRLTAEELDAVRQIAVQRGCSLAEVGRVAIRRYLEMAPTTTNPCAAVGAARSWRPRWQSHVT